MSNVADEWGDMMPHRITVSGKGVPDRYGDTVIDPATIRVYRCLIDDNSTTRRDASGETVTVALTAYVDAIPIDAAEPWPINVENDTVEFTPPPLGQPSSRPISGVESHYWKDGSLHNQVVRFT